jgi:5-formyltetrahydrofolate cyclo-ligase
MSKSELRTQLKQQRLSLTQAEYTLKSRAIVARLKALQDWSSVQTVHCFEPFKELLEPDISDFMIYMEDLGVEVFVPRLVEGEWEMVSVQPQAAPAEFDVVIVPMLGFDAGLHRLGYGGGYYDRFLAAQPAAHKIGVCFESGWLERLPVEPHDVALDVVITEDS